MKIVMTGGPCAGKSSLLSMFAKLDQTSVVHEAATSLWAKGWQSSGQEAGYSHDWKIAFQIAVMEAQLSLEERAMREQPVFLICDRGISDGPAYLCDVPRSKYDLQRFLASYGDEPGQYHLIIHLTSLAISQPKLYGNRDNEFRTESVSDACKIDDLIWKSWEHTRIPQVRIDTSKSLPGVFDEVAELIQRKSDRPS